VQIPLEYYDINVGGTLTLLRSMVRYGVRRLVFSSSCSIYGDHYSEPITEDDAPGPVSPYARTKHMGEQILADACARFEDLSVIALRYFNPVGAHPSGTLGEVPRGVPTNLMPHMMQVAAGIRERLHVFGGDYPTPDGSAVRDYIHVMDLAEAHRIALDHLAEQRGMQAFNLGTGVGISVLELVRAFEDSCGTKVPISIVERRAGDTTSAVADPSKVDKHWGWRTKLDIYDMCRDAWRFQQLHMDGYAE
jgi:UDP-glucose 4-epimerase